MLAEARGYRLSLVLAHQDLAQLPRPTQLALSANARNKITFNVAPEDAHQMARHMFPELSEHDLSHLDAYQAAARLVIGNRETASFTLHTRPPRPVVGAATHIRAACAAASGSATDPTAIEQLAKRLAVSERGVHPAAANDVGASCSIHRSGFAPWSAVRPGHGRCGQPANQSLLTQQRS